MYKKIIIAICIYVLTIVKAEPISADTLVVSSSAQLKKDFFEEKSDTRVATLKKFLEKYNSPLADYSHEFVYYADMYDIDWRLVPAISGVESTFGKRIPQGSYNAYGWANGKYQFKSWDDSIEIVTRTLREKYYNRGADSIAKIARRYAPPSTTWGSNVKFFMNKIDSIPVEFDL